MLTFALCISMTVAAPVPKGVDDKFEKAVSEGRTRGIDYLKRMQNQEGNWEGVILKVIADMDGGQTSLVTLSLLEAGTPVNDPAITKAVDYLAKLPPNKTYVVSLQTQVLARIDAKIHQGQIQKNADWLVAQAIKTNDKLEGWSYPGNLMADGSNTHFAMMGLHAAAKAGAKVDEKLWQQARDMYLRTQTDDGWPYLTSIKDRSTRSMTACALVGLLVAAKHDKNAKLQNEAFDKGLTLLMPWDLQSQKSTGYAMMVVAELGRLYGKNEFKVAGKNWEWYRVGAEMLIKLQQEDGSLAVPPGNGVDNSRILFTSFGLYFLGPPAKK
jgi:hypothetical protein